ncbi:hypothetical protein DENSPDRAFT_844643 [Dentipellis sp. KUC8613]|nr:hypothetical protein DENSPDRAFT_844643 [Dentipellis sp. KUC8613]
MAITAVISVVKTLISVGSTVYDVYKAANAGEEITLQDVVRLLQSSNVRIFAQLNISRIQTARDQFYSVSLPTFTAQSRIRQADITGRGHLKQTYDKIRNDEGKVWVALQDLNWLFQNNALHVDDYHFFARMMTQAYVLVVHMRAVTLHLRSVELFDKLDLDDRRMLEEYLTLELYLKQGISQLAAADKKVRCMRLDMISPVEKIEVRDGKWSQRNYAWRDTYKKLGSTAREQQLAAEGTVANYGDADDVYHAAREGVERKREERINGAMGIYARLTGNNLDVVKKGLGDIQGDVENKIKRMQARVITRGGNTGRIEGGFGMGRPGRGGCFPSGI